MCFPLTLVCAWEKAKGKRRSWGFFPRCKWRAANVQLRAPPAPKRGLEGALVILSRLCNLEIECRVSPVTALFALGFALLALRHGSAALVADRTGLGGGLLRLAEKLQKADAAVRTAPDGPGTAGGGEGGDGVGDGGVAVEGGVEVCRQRCTCAAQDGAEQTAAVAVVAAELGVDREGPCRGCEILDRQVKHPRHGVVSANAEDAHSGAAVLAALALA